MRLFPAILISSCLLAPTTLLGKDRAHSAHQPAPKPAQINAPQTTHGLVFKTPAALSVYAHDTVSVGDPIPVSAYVKQGLAALVPNGTHCLILSPRLQSVPHTGARYVAIRLTGGPQKGRTGYILWEELAALSKSIQKPK